jgi:glutathione S-transferase
MAANIEIEAKVLISLTDYQKMVKTYEANFSKEYDQYNYYIDTKDFKLKALGIGLRIRLFEGSYMLTLKAPLAEGLLEKDQDIKKVNYDTLADKNLFPEGNIKEFIKMIGITPDDLKILCSLKTHRIEIDDGDNTRKISLDKNEYNGIVDYEIELESDSLSRAKESLKKLCEKNGIEYKDNPKSKQSRAMETIA